MIRFLTAVLLFASFHVAADELKPFSNGQVINADDFNHNFQKLEQDIANGVTGPQGEQGPAGPQGEQGEKGEKGDKGDTGDTGPQGPVGNNGAPGIQGDKGDTGDQGPAGADGVAAGLSCTTDQIIVYRDGAWVCSELESVDEPVDGDRGEAICPSGKKVTGGGCHIILYQADWCSRQKSKPRSDLAGWECEALGSGCDIRNVYAVCQ